jgi:hypothetical protein
MTIEGRKSGGDMTFVDRCMRNATADMRATSDYLNRFGTAPPSLHRCLQHLNLVQKR